MGFEELCEEVELKRKNEDDASIVWNRSEYNTEDAYIAKEERQQQQKEGDTLAAQEDIISDLLDSIRKGFEYDLQGHTCLEHRHRYPSDIEEFNKIPVPIAVSGLCRKNKTEKSYMADQEQAKNVIKPSGKVTVYFNGAPIYFPDEKDLHNISSLKTADEIILEQKIDDTVLIQSGDLILFKQITKDECAASHHIEKMMNNTVQFVEYANPHFFTIGGCGLSFSHDCVRKVLRRFGTSYKHEFGMFNHEV